MWKKINKLIKPSGAICLFGSEPFSSALRISNIKNYKYDWIWDKVQPTGATLCNIQPMKNHEIISVFSNGKCKYNPQMENREKELSTVNWAMSKLNSENGNFSCTDHSKTKKVYKQKYPRSIITFHKSKQECNNTKRVHPTQKPVVLMEYLIKTYTNEHDLVLDFTAGSFSTGVACINTNRKFIGIELDKNYFEIGRKRIEETIKTKSE